MPASTPPQHPAKSLEPPLEVLESMGFNNRSCLQGTGIKRSQLENPRYRLTFQQEQAFYRNVLELTSDPLIGLKLGEPFVPQRYGLLGYTLLSSSTLRQAMKRTVNFGKHSFSFFTFHFEESGEEAWFGISEHPPIDKELHDVYLDRDMSAAVVGFGSVLGQRLPLLQVHFAHEGHDRREDYEEHFGCEVRFSSVPSRLVFPAALLDARLPQSDPGSVSYFRQQCRMLVARLKHQGNFIEDVRMLLLSQPGRFPGIAYVADKLSVSVRTLRRRLDKEGSSFRELLEDVRFQMAQQYLTETGLPIADIAELLGYTEPGNFSHAFRRWSGQSPRRYRWEQSAGP